MLAIIDYGAGNLQSVKKALDYIGAAAEITADPCKIKTARGVILPGVGSFGDAMDSLRSQRLFEVVRQAADGARPFLGICLGQQLLFGSSEESPGTAGLAVLPGKVVKIPAQNLQNPAPAQNPKANLINPAPAQNPKANLINPTPAQNPKANLINPTSAHLKIPHMGWNSIALQRHDGLFAGVPEGAYVYFVHSFYVRAQVPAQVAATTEYGATIHAAVSNGLLWATQFHPEKSGEVGLVMLKNFVGMTN